MNYNFIYFSYFVHDQAGIIPSDIDTMTIFLKFITQRISINLRPGDLI
jgi:hypothetical protein